MPKLVPHKPKPMAAPKKPIHQRLGKRNSVCESIHTSQLQLYKPYSFKAKAKAGVQSRLGKNWVSPAVHERNRIAMHALQTFAKNAGEDEGKKMLLSAFGKAIEAQAEPEKKYDMKIQKEICSLQVS